VKKLLMATPLVVLALVLVTVGCSKKNPTIPTDTTVDDNTAITNAVAASDWADVSDYGNDGSAGFAKDDPFPGFVHWRRRITGETRTAAIQFDSANTFATVTINKYFDGYFVVDNTNNGVVDTIVRPFRDHGVRYVWLRKIRDHWRIWGASPLDIATDSASTKVVIDSVRITGTSGPRPSVLFAGSTYFQTRRRDEMPIFDAGATVTVNVYGNISGASYPADSAWAFLHRRIHVGLDLFHHLRLPLDRVSGQPFVFTKTWTVADDSISVRPALRHGCVDMILGSTLFDTTHVSPKPYSAHLWTMPYIVVNTVNDSLPE